MVVLAGRPLWRPERGPREGRDLGDPAPPVSSLAASRSAPPAPSKARPPSAPLPRVKLDHRGGREGATDGRGESATGQTCRQSEIPVTGTLYPVRQSRLHGHNIRTRLTLAQRVGQHRADDVFTTTLTPVDARPEPVSKRRGRTRCRSLSHHHKTPALIEQAVFRTSQSHSCKHIRPRFT